ncbi:MAG TPA: hypothetical protein VJ930_06085 [Acidimicrobiia bacterium]|nr:hypothetical protein [Acidimicrobiia bacterium]
MAVAVTGLIGLASIGWHLTRRKVGRPYWVVVGLGIGVMAVQVILGLIAMNFEGIDPGNQHVFYGVVISFTLAFTYIYRSQFRKKPALYYGLLMLFLMGLGLRGIMAFGGNF